MADIYNVNSFLSAAERNAIAEIEATTAVLRLITRLTNLKFATICKFSEDSWIACSGLGELYLGGVTGEPIPPELELCRQTNNMKDMIRSKNNKPNRLSYQHIPLTKDSFISHIALPIVLSNGNTYGTLCGLSSTLSTPKDISEIVDTLYLFSNLVATIIEIHTMPQE